MTAVRAFVASALALLMATACDPGQPEPDRGRYYWGAEVRVVCPCGAAPVEPDGHALCFWTRTDPETQARLKSFVQRHSDSPYQGFYLVYRGQLLDEAPVGFGASYDGLMRIDEIVELSAAVPADCQAP